MAALGTVLGFYQDRSSGWDALARLRSSGRRRSACIHRDSDGSVAVIGRRLPDAAAAALIVVAALFTAWIVGYASERLLPAPNIPNVLGLALAGVAGAAAAVFASYALNCGVARATIARYSKLVTPDETLVIARAPFALLGQALEVLRGAPGDPPVTFALPSEFGFCPEADLGTVYSAPLTAAGMRASAVSLARTIRGLSRSVVRRQPLSRRLRAAENALSHVHAMLADTARLGKPLSMAAEWLLDNAYILQGHIAEFRRCLPRGFYETLPVIGGGPLAGLPRTYAIASELVRDTEGRLDPDGIHEFVKSYQTDAPLTIGELWALPLMVRLALIEFVQQLAQQVERREREREQADFWANRALHVARRDPQSMGGLMSELAHVHGEPSAHLGEQLLGYLRDDESAIVAVRRWLETAFNVPLPTVFQQEGVLEAAQQVALANAISSLRLFTHLRWQDSFERLSAVEAILRTDPAGVYPQMDFATRDRYRRSVESISRSSKLPETEVADLAVSLAASADGDPNRHVGYYLVDTGKSALEAATGGRPAARERARRWVRRHCAAVYLGGVSAITVAVMVALMVGLARDGAGLLVLSIIGAFALLPASELAVQAANYIGMRLMPPHFLPRMCFEDGIPDQFRTLVVIPMMLLTPESIREEAEHLRIRYLANRDPNLLYGLLSDFSDAPLEEMPEDVERLEVAEQCIARLDAEYGPGRFFLFHRRRRWSDGEGRWIGWERKRGKLEHLNRYLSGELEMDNLLRVGEAGPLKSVRFVITLDSDTQLPRDAGRRLVETLAHPLNRPVISEDGRSIVRGYAIIQPRVSTSLPSATATLFSRVFADTTGIDPYTQAVSDIYQDLSGEATYHGKGIYDLAVFHRMLSARLPDNLILSHDLLEGAHVRVGLATDIELLDLFPQDYVAYSKRQHRWTRGDWQIMDWVWPRVPAGGAGRTPNPLSVLSRWKIADNLRRSLVPVGSLGLLASGWALSTMSAFISLFVAAVLLLPSLAPALWRLTAGSRTRAAAYREIAIGVVRAVVTAALLPHQAAAALDAICRTIHRRAVTHRLLLEWETAHDAGRHSRDRLHRHIIRMAWAPLLSLASANAIAAIAPAATLAAAPYLMLWTLSPLLAAWLCVGSRPRRIGALSNSDRRMLRQVARQTWRYFADFAGPDTNWLPPDNYQDDLRIEVAQRTSPTNIGLGLLAVLAARDFGFIDLDAALTRIGAAVETLGKLELHQGHPLNWYDVRSLAPLPPRYVSMVDSGNLIGSLWALEQGILEMIAAPVIGPEALDGLGDALALATASAAGSGAADVAVQEAVTLLRGLTAPPPPGLEALMRSLRAAAHPAGVLADDLCRRSADKPECVYWAGMVESEVTAWNDVMDRYLAWMDVLATPPAGGLSALGPDAHVWRRQAMDAAPSLQMLADGHVPGLSSLVGICLRKEELALSEAACDWLDRLTQARNQAQSAARERVAEAGFVLDRIRAFGEGVDMSFVYDADRRLFSTGYNVSELRMDVGHYDLLASEARLGSFVAIARGETPVEHWWALGRPYGSACRPSALLSWNGSMFEYLMPLLLTRTFDHSMLDKACRDAVDCHTAYGRRRRVPWGISEAAFSALDSRQTYQYRSFGVPGLGIKRGLQDDLVVAPYATALALAVNAPAAVRNLRTLSGLPNLQTRGCYGFYDAIDYTRRRGPDSDRGVVVRTYMAHHQGMILAAIDNALNESVFQERFHLDPRVRASESLLYERIPVAPAVVDGKTPDEPLPRTTHHGVAARSMRIDTAATPSPRTNILSNGRYSVMVTNAGGGWSRWRGLAVSRWRADATMDSYGSFCYLKDVDSGAVWSACHHPVCSAPQRYSVVFDGDRAEFRRTEAGIETVLEVVVSPEDDVEVRRLTLMNRSVRRRRIELTSYMEIALAPHDADRAHPAFSKMFVQTEAVPTHHGLLAWRRPRSDAEAPSWALHVSASDSEQPQATQHETDRARFIGRGRTMRAPAALDADLTGATGSVLDPVFSLRRTVILEAGERAEVAFVTGSADSREEAMRLVEKYADISAVRRALTMAWTHAELELRRLGIRPEDAQRFQQLAAHVMYPNPLLRPPAARLARNTLGQAGLWTYGISGDLPIVVVTISDGQDLDVVRQTLLAHAYWRARGLRVDLVVLSEHEEGTTYDQPLKDSLRSMIESESVLVDRAEPGGLFMIPSATMPEEDRDLLLTSARVVLVAARGPLAQHLGAAGPPRALPPDAPAVAPTKEQPSSGLPFLDLTQFNGLGGFTPDGREYAIYLGDGVETPLPWVNVMANPLFGSMVSESGSGPTWYGNSQGNRLTPWSNDPICDPVSDAIYIRDDAVQVCWSPTPRPIREQDAYRVRHGQGYTVYEHNSHAIEQELTILVPMDEAGGEPVRLEQLRLRNQSTTRRRLTVTFYCAWVLGVHREETQLYVTTGWDAQGELFLARNPGRPDYGGRVAFVAADVPVQCFTGDRAEFIGRNGDLPAPAAMRRTRLSGNVGAGLDPCAAVQVAVDIEPHHDAEVVFMLGQGADEDDVRRLAQRYRQPGAFDEALAETRRWWDEKLETVQVSTPEPSVDVLLSRWLLYQALSCRIWARTAFYQSGGAYGFRDQLQDVMGLVHAAPGIAREHILRAASRQFVEGDVQHWWHPESGAGVRTRISDDPLWLPYVAAHYVRTTGDRAIMKETVPFLDGDALAPDEHERFFVPTISARQASLLDHCRLAVARATTAGPSGLPLIGSGDWSDGLNRVGVLGKGESVWLAWFLIHVLNDLAELIDRQGDGPEAANCRDRATRLAASVEQHAWDGGWYWRATFDDGTPIGSGTCREGQIDSLAQSWAVICGAADPARAAAAMRAVEERLVRRDDRMVLLLAPPFATSSHDPGYIMAYPPGVRENGGQYTHGSLWAPQALARLGLGDGAVEMLSLMNPLSHAMDLDEVERYRVEPYVAVADVYSLAGHVGRGGWTWYTGSAALMYRVWIEEVLGFRRRGDVLSIDPAVPMRWDGFTVRYRHGSADYVIEVGNPDHLCGGVAAVTVDGELVLGSSIDLRDDGAEHSVSVQMGVRADEELYHAHRTASNPTPDRRLIRASPSQ